MNPLAKLLLILSFVVLCPVSIQGGENGEAPGDNAEIFKREKNKDIRPCQADISIGYLQFVTRARVDTVIENSDCAASSGQYEVQIQIIDESNELHVIEHVESWGREDDTPYKSRKLYDIGKNVELFRTTVRGLTCRCDSEVTE